MNQIGEQDGFNEVLDRLLVDARGGSTEARNELFSHVQRYLSFIAKQHQNPKLAAKAGASDIVQQTLLHAAEEFDQFRGSTAEQFRGWLRQILVNEVRGLNRQFGAQRRNTSQEVNLATGDSSSQHQQELSNGDLTPSHEMMAVEDTTELQVSMRKLPRDMQQVIQLRNWEKLQFNEIAERMKIPASTAAKLWYRALIELQKIHAGTSQHE